MAISKFTELLDEVDYPVNSAYNVSLEDVLAEYTFKTNWSRHSSLSTSSRVSSFSSTASNNSNSSLAVNTFDATAAPISTPSSAAAAKKSKLRGLRRLTSRHFK